MSKDKTLKENIEWLLNQYKKELEEERKDTSDQNMYVINDFENIITELEFALMVSKKGDNL